MTKPYLTLQEALREAFKDEKRIDTPRNIRKYGNRFLIPTDNAEKNKFNFLTLEEDAELISQLQQNG